MFYLRIRIQNNPEMKVNIILVTISLALVCCKKKEETSSIQAQANTGVIASPYTVSQATSFHGGFASTDFIQVNGSSIQEGKYFFAYFSKEPTTASTLPLNVYAGDVRFNGTSMVFDPGTSSYRIPLLSNFTTETWEVTGANGIPAFNHRKRNDNPKWSYFTPIPNSISISKGFKMTVNGVENTTSGAIAISEMSGSSNGQVTKELHPGDNIISFSPEELSVLHPTDHGFVFINLENHRSLNFYGKDFKVSKEKSYAKLVKITP